VDKYNIQAPVRNKKKHMHIFKGFEDQSDTYHDTRTHYLMKQEPSQIHDQSEVLDVVVANKVEVLKGRKYGPSMTMLNVMSPLWDIITLQRVMMTRVAR
jgi:hypothetical protein